MATSKLDLVKLMNIAWERRKETTAEEYEEKVKNLISHAFVEYENIYVNYCKDKNIKYNDDVFYLFHICAYCKSMIGISIVSVEGIVFIYILT